MQPQRIILHSPLPLKSAILPSMKALYRFLLMLLLALPALNVLAASADMAMAGEAIISADCMQHETHAACHQKMAKFRRMPPVQKRCMACCAAVLAACNSVRLPCSSKPPGLPPR
jgi:hypothetical protein